MRTLSAHEMNAFTPNAKTFIQSFVDSGGDYASAYRASYGHGKSLSDAEARRQGVFVLRDRKIAAAVAQTAYQPLVDAVMDAREVVMQWVAMARADVREIVTHRRINCRHCYGHNFLHQWKDPAEFSHALAQSMDQNARGVATSMPITDGGYGFRRNAPPNPDCPKCEGDGYSDVYLADFTTLSPGAALLYDGIKTTQHGIEVKVRSRDDALVNLAKWLKVIAPDVAPGYLPMPPGETLDMPQNMDDALIAYEGLVRGL